MYHYRPLEHSQEIRLLHIKPGDDTSDIHCYITHRGLTTRNDLGYEALSYTWGDPNNKSLVICSEDGATISVSINCKSALRRLRRHDKERVLWTDAVCIDQSNIPERNQQLQLMPAIYHGASKVLVYLGEASIDSDLGMDFIQEDHDSLCGSSNRPPVGISASTTSSPQQLAIDSLTARPYFERVWIQQEVKSAVDVDVLCGSRTVEWRAFSRTVYYVDINKKIHLMRNLYTAPPKVIFSRDVSIADEPKTLLQYLDYTRHCKATDPRDKIYALISMTPEAREKGLKPDYSVPVRDTFIGLARFLIMRDNKLDVLCQVQGTPTVPDLPTWVPDWSTPPVSQPLGYPKTSPRFSAANGLPAVVTFSKHSDVLTARGLVLDTIIKVGKRYGPEVETATGDLMQWEQLARNFSSTAAAPGPDVAFLETLTAASPSGIGGTPNSHIRLYSDAWYSMFMKGEKYDGPGASGENAKAQIFNELLNRACRGRRFVVTKKGCIGLGPTDVEVGDTTVVLLGGQVPFVLRRHGGDRERWKMVGECYVRGYMKGEALEEREDGVFGNFDIE